MESLSIITDTPASEFLSHIARSERIILSGPFGIGKTHFLNKYFDKRSDSFAVINLRPINYSVSTNEDIFQLIKYDIIFELLKLHNTLDIFRNTKLPDTIIREFFYVNQFGEILEKFLASIEKINKSALDLTKFVASLGNEYEKFRKKHIEALDELKTIEQFDKSFRNKIGSIYENDFITELINDALDRIKEKGKKPILILDDIDRIDPEHIFRLLNVFGAHFDLRGEKENKYKFDSIIIVCDLKNIKSIFNHKYGANVDFDGYIDKFYTDRIFYYNNFSAIKEWLEDSFKSTHELNKQNKSSYNFLLSILCNLSLYNLLNLRSLLKLNTLTPFSRNIYPYLGNEDLDDLLLTDTFFALKTIYQDPFIAIEKIAKLASIKDKEDHISNTNDIISYLDASNNRKIDLLKRFLIPVLVKRQQKRNPNADTIKVADMEIVYEVNYHEKYFIEIKLIDGKPANSFTNFIPIWSILVECLSTMTKMM